MISLIVYNNHITMWCAVSQYSLGFINRGMKYKIKQRGYDVRRYKPSIYGEIIDIILSTKEGNTNNYSHIQNILNS